MPPETYSGYAKTVCQAPLISVWYTILVANEQDIQFKQVNAGTYFVGLFLSFRFNAASCYKRVNLKIAKQEILYFEEKYT